MARAGFEGFNLVWGTDVYSGAPQESSAAQFETHGVNFRAKWPGRRNR